AAIAEDIEWSVYAEVFDIMQDTTPPKPSDAIKFQTRIGGALPSSRRTGDYNNDGVLDDCAAVKPPEGSYSQCLWLDYDHDYDLDLLLFGDRSALLRNQGPAGFAERSTDIPFIAGGVTGTAALRLVADTKGIDFIVAYAAQPAILYRDRLQGVFKAEKLTIAAGAQSL